MLSRLQKTGTEQKTRSANIGARIGGAIVGNLMKPVTVLKRCLKRTKREQTRKNIFHQIETNKTMNYRNMRPTVIELYKVLCYNIFIRNYFSSSLIRRSPI